MISIKNDFPVYFLSNSCPSFNMELSDTFKHFFVRVDFTNKIKNDRTKFTQLVEFGSGIINTKAESIVFSKWYNHILNFTIFLGVRKIFNNFCFFKTSYYS